MNNQIHTDTNRRHDFVLLIDATYSNPNGDPDNGGQPRVDPETMHGLVTDVALKRKVRDWVDMVKEGEEGYSIYVQHRGILANQQKRAFEALKHGPTAQPDEEARVWMCQRYYDIRLFGAVMSLGKSGQKAKGGVLHWNCGQVRGPVQLTFARSIDPVTVLDLTITRVALTNADDTLRGAESEGQEVASSGTMGRKAVIPYGLYMAHGYFSPQLARRTGVSEADLALFWEALEKL